MNLPVVYLLELEDSGRTALPKDQYRWPEVQTHLMGQALAGLKLLTIAKGFDEAFDDLHPKSLRRLHLGPMYSHGYTRQFGPLHAVLAEAKAPEGEDWALAWTREELESERVEKERSGWFGTVDREVFALDPFAGRARTPVRRGWSVVLFCRSVPIRFWKRRTRLAFPPCESLLSVPRGVC